MASVTRSDIFTDPVQFQSAILGRNIWKTQRDICRAILDHERVSVKSCHASGKTFVASGLVPWWLIRYQKGIVINTAPTMRQVKLMWNEIALACRECKIALPEPGSTSLKLSENRYAMGVSSSRGVNIQGFHGDHVLIIADEAPGIEPEIWDSLEGVMAGGDIRLLKLGNPTVPSGNFYEDFTRGRSSVKTFTISAFDTPNFEGVTMERLLQMSDDELGVSVSPYLIGRRWVKDRYIRWGPNNPRFQSRVLGLFPSQADDAVFSLEWIEKAALDPEPEQLERLKGRVIQVGIDVAGPGDDESTMVARVGGAVLLQKAWSLPDPRGEIAVALGNLRALRDYKLGPVVVDAVGIGYGMALHLADLGFEVHAFNAGASPVDSEHFVNAKAEAHWSLREWMERGAIRGVTDEEAQAQMSGIKYRHTPSGRIEIESKEDMRKRGAASPDRAEALVMAFVPIVPREQLVTYEPEYSISPY